MLLCAAPVVGCSSHPPATAAPSPSTEHGIQGASTVPNSVVSTTLPPISVPQPAESAPRAEAEAVVDVGSDGLGLEGDERSCLVDKLAADGELLGKLRPGVVRGSVEYQSLARLAQRCIDGSRSARPFAAAAQEAAGGKLSDSTVDCLAAAYRNLSPDDATALTDGSVNPAAQEKSQQITASLYRGCGLDPPR